MTSQHDNEFDDQLSPLCIECVRDLPLAGSDLCAFCTVTAEEVE